MYKNGKMRPVEIIPGMKVGRVKENDGVGEFKSYIVRILVNITVYPQYNNMIIKILTTQV
jgi:hypothetical protein